MVDLPVIYISHDEDEVAINALRRLKTEINYRIEDTPARLEDLFRISEPLHGKEVACATHLSIAVVAVEGDFYNGRHLRIFAAQSKRRERFLNNIPLWAQSAAFVVLLDPNADREKLEPGSHRNCFAKSLLMMHLCVGGDFPRKQRPKRGRKARVKRDANALREERAASAL
jgi:hypothetical protein